MSEDKPGEEQPEANDEQVATDDPKPDTDEDLDFDANSNDDPEDAEVAENEDEPPVFERREASGANRQKRAVFSVPVEVTVSVGKAQPLIGDLLKMRRDSLIPLDSKIEDPVELCVAGRVIARGELQEMDDGSNHLGVRLTEIIDMTDAL